MSRGSALLLTLWCVAILSITILAVARMVDGDVSAQSLQSRRFEAREMAMTGIAYGLHPKIKPWNELLNQKQRNGDELRVVLSSEAARLDINAALREQGQPVLRELFKFWGVPDEELRATVDSLSDWIDEDELKSLNGAEREDLGRDSPYSIPKNRDFRSVAEMANVRGMDVVAEVKPDWQKYFTVFGGRRVDLQDASVDVMRAAGIPIDQAKQIVRLRSGPDEIEHTADDLEIKDAAQFLKQVGVFNAEGIAPRFSAGNGPTRIESTGTVGGTEFRIAAIARRPEGAGRSTLLNWEEE